MKKITILLITLIVIGVGFLSGCNEQTLEAAPTINFFTITPTTVIKGNSSVLNWFVENATSVSIDNGIGNVTFSGSKTIVPTQNQTYTLTAFNSYGSSNASVKVYVIDINENTSEEDLVPIINSFTATPSVIVLGNTSLLKWSVKGATNISIDNEIGYVPLSGPYTVKPTQNTTYTLTAFNSYGSSNASVKVYVNEQPSEEGTAPIIHSFTAAPIVIVLGNTSLLKWSITGATSVSINEGIGNVNLSGPYIVKPTQNTTYTLTAFNSYGSSNASVKVYVSVNSENKSPKGPFPIINYFTATPNPVDLGDSTVLKWSVTGATSVSIDNAIGIVDFIGSYTFSPSTSKKYILTASNENGTTAEFVYLSVRT